MADNPGLTPEQQAVEQAALDRVAQGEADNLSQATGESEGVPDGYNADGTPIQEGLILDKFNSQEDLIAAYKELEAKMGSNSKTPEEPTPVPVVAEVPKVADGVLKQDDFNSYYQEVSDNGTLGEDSYKALEAKGLSKEVVDNYIAGQKAIADSAVAMVQETVGGAEAYGDLITWATDNLSDGQKQDFNTKITSNDPVAAKEATEYLQYLRNKADPQPPKRIQGDSYSGNVGGLKAFSDRGEHSKATSNRLYGRDAKYTNMVDARYLASKKAGTI